MKFLLFLFQFQKLLFSQQLQSVIFKIINLLNF